MATKTVKYKGESYEIPVEAKTKQEKIDALRPLVIARREQRQKEREAVSKVRMTPSMPGMPGIAPIFLPPSEDQPEAVREAQRQAFERQQDLATLMASGPTFGLPAKALSMVGVTGPQERVEAARERTGGLGTAIEIASMLPTGIIGAKRALPSLVKRFGPRAGGAIVGAGEGLLGYLGTTGRGEETLPGAAVSTAVGPIVGIAGEPVARFAEYLGRTPLELARRKIGGAMGARRGPQATVTTAEELAEVAGETRPRTIAEQIGGEAAEGLEPLVEKATKSITAEDRAARDILLQRMEERASGRPSRIFADSAMPPAQKIEDMMKNIELGKEEASQIYRQAYDSPLPPSDDFVDVLNTPSFRDSAKGAVKLIGDEREKLTVVRKVLGKDGKPVSKRFPLKADDLIGEKNIRNTLETVENPTMVVDYMIRGLDDKIAKSKKPQQRSAMLRLKYDLLDEIKEINPAYNQARNTYSGVMARENAREQGAKIASIPESDFRKLMDKMPDDEREYFTIGAMDFIKEEITKPNFGKLKGLVDKGGDFENVVTRRLRYAFPDKESFTKFSNTVSDEFKMLDMEKVGKATMAEAEGIFERGLGALYVRQSATRPGAPGVFFNLSNAARRFVTGGMSPDEAEEVVDILTRYTPEGRKEVMADLVRAGRINEEVSREVQEMLLPYTVPAAITGSQIAPRDEE